MNIEQTFTMKAIQNGVIVTDKDGKQFCYNTPTTFINSMTTEMDQKFAADMEHQGPHEWEIKVTVKSVNH